MLLIVVNLCLAIERKCFYLFFKLFHFATVVLSNNNVRKQDYMAIEHVFSTSK